MANIYKNSKLDLTTASATPLYTVPSNSRAIIKSILVCDDSGSGSTITITITDISSNIFVLFNVKSISANTTEQLLSEPLVLEESEILTVTAADANRLHVVASIFGNQQRGQIMPFVEQEESFKDEIIEGKTVKVYKPRVEITLKNLETGQEYISDAEALADVQTLIQLLNQSTFLEVCM
jgi:hypothetical protein